MKKFIERVVEKFYPIHMESEPPKDIPEEQSETNIVHFPLNEYMQTRQRHPSGRLGRKSAEQTLRELEVENELDDFDKD